MTFSDKTSQLFLNRKKIPQLSFQHYKPSTYKPLTYVILRYGFSKRRVTYVNGIKIEVLFHKIFSLEFFYD